MADRVQVQDLQKSGLRPSAQPVNDYFRPVANTVDLVAPDNTFGALADAIKSAKPAVEGFMQSQYEQATVKDTKAGQDARIKNQKDFKDAVAQGLIPEASNPWFVKGYMQMDGRESGMQLDAAMRTAWSTSDVKESNDPQALTKFMADFTKQWLQDKSQGQTPDWMDGFKPELAKSQNNLAAEHIAHRQAEISKGARDVAGQVVDSLIKRQQEREVGMDPNDPLVSESRAANAKQISEAMAGLVRQGLPGSDANAIIIKQAAAAGVDSMDETLTRSILDGVTTPGGKLSGTAEARQTINQVESHVLDMKNQMKVRAWADQDRPYAVEARNFGVKQREMQQKQWDKDILSEDRKDRIQGWESKLLTQVLEGVPWNPADLIALGKDSKESVGWLKAFRDAELERKEKITVDKGAYATLMTRISEGGSDVTQREIWNGVKGKQWDIPQAAAAMNELQQMQRIDPLDHDKSFTSMKYRLGQSVAASMEALGGAGQANAGLAEEDFRVGYTEIMKNEKLSPGEKRMARNELYIKVIKHYNEIASTMMVNGTNGVTSQEVKPTEQHIKMLLQNPDKAADFDRAFGKGAAAQILKTATTPVSKVRQEKASGGRSEFVAEPGASAAPSPVVPVVKTNYNFPKGTPERMRLDAVSPGGDFDALPQADKDRLFQAVFSDILPKK